MTAAPIIGTVDLVDGHAIFVEPGDGLTIGAPQTGGVSMTDVSESHEDDPLFTAGVSEGARQMKAPVEAHDQTGTYLEWTLGESIWVNSGPLKDAIWFENPVVRLWKETGYWTMEGLLKCLKRKFTVHVAIGARIYWIQSDAAPLHHVSMGNGEVSHKYPKHLTHNGTSVPFQSHVSGFLSGEHYLVLVVSC